MNTSSQDQDINEFRTDGPVFLNPQSCPQQILIDQDWISPSCQLPFNVSLITCPVCYTIPINNPVQCSNCQLIFCQHDYNTIVKSSRTQIKRCHVCRMYPWKKKQKIHLSYKNMFETLKFRCKICYDQGILLMTQHTPMSKDQLIKHLQMAHNMVLSLDSLLFDFVLKTQDGSQIALSWIQNLQINIRRKMGCNKFRIATNRGRMITVDLIKMKASHPTGGECQMISSMSKELKRNKKYIIWAVDLDYRSQREEQNQSEQRTVTSYFNLPKNHQYMFYSEEMQEQIEHNFQQFVENSRLNEFHLDSQYNRYRINFSEKTQTNTFTKSKKPILRVPIIFE